MKDKMIDDRDCEGRIYPESYRGIAGEADREGKVARGTEGCKGGRRGIDEVRTKNLRKRGHRINIAGWKHFS
ncbi:hypothetical protein NQZ68_014157 [Dissostichus eleginoides]|nr:hypothetical protein NQZ68_014157 [Dissostichus eleginoides]